MHYICAMHFVQCTLEKQCTANHYIKTHMWHRCLEFTNECITYSMAYFDIDQKIRDNVSCQRPSQNSIRQKCTLSFCRYATSLGSGLWIAIFVSNFIPCESYTEWRRYNTQSERVWDSRIPQTAVEIHPMTIDNYKIKAIQRKIMHCPIQETQMELPAIATISMRHTR